MCCINIHFIVNPFTFNKYRICNLFCITVFLYHILTLYNKVYFDKNFMNLLMLSWIQRINPMFYNENNIIKYATKHIKQLKILLSLRLPDIFVYTLMLLILLDIFNCGSHVKMVHIFRPVSGIRRTRIVELFSI